MCLLVSLSKCCLSMLLQEIYLEMKDMKFNQIDIEKWNRKEYYIHYMNELCCTYSLTVNIDITNLKTVVKKNE